MVLYNLLSSSLIFLIFQPLLVVSYFISKQPKKAKRSKVKLQVRLINGEKDSLSTTTSRTWH